MKNWGSLRIEASPFIVVLMKPAVHEVNKSALPTCFGTPVSQYRQRTISKRLLKIQQEVENIFPEQNMPQGAALHAKIEG
ncbi:MAG: hypothetical protein EA344_03815 [Alkalicoccus sp.]|nr:MAG: hypothetical protein EA344_03815 [Alkalicoccus sp.]